MQHPESWPAELAKQNVLLIRENQQSTALAIQIMQLSWPTNAFKVKLLQALLQLPVLELEGDDPRQDLLNRIDRLWHNTMELTKALNGFLKHFEKTRNKPASASLLHHFFGGFTSADEDHWLVIMQEDRNVRWPQLLACPHGELSNQLQQQFDEWFEQPSFTLDFAKMMQAQINLLQQSVQALLSDLPSSAAITSSSYQTYLMAYSQALSAISRQQVNDLPAYGKRDVEYWFHKYYVQEYLGSRELEPRISAKELPQLYQNFYCG